MELMTANGTYAVNDIHPCYVLDNTTYVFTSNPSILCVSVYSFIGLLCVATICGNLLVITSIFYFKQLQIPTNYLVLSLAVADLLVGVVVLPFNMAFTTATCYYNADLSCIIRDGFDITLCTSSILHLCCISIDRYYAVCQPLIYRMKIDVRVILIMILMSWGTATLIAIGILIPVSQDCEETCTVDFHMGIAVPPLFGFYLPAIVMLCIYLKIFLVAQKQVNSIQTTTCQSKKSGAIVSKMERKATKTLAIVMGVFLLCMIPYFLYAVFLPVVDKTPPLYVNETLCWLTWSNSMLNPFIYAFFYSWFRSAFKMIISGKIFRDDLSNSKLF